MIKVEDGGIEIHGERRAVISEMAYMLYGFTKMIITREGEDNAIHDLSALFLSLVHVDEEDDVMVRECAACIESAMAIAESINLGIPIVPDDDDEQMEIMEEQIKDGDAVSELLKKMFGAS